MKISDFEVRHPATIHQAIVAAAFATCFFERDDVVWQFVKHSKAPVLFERSLFAVATLLVGAAAVVCTRYRQESQPSSPNRESTAREPRRRGSGELLYAIGLGSLAPLTGFVILVGGEALRIFRLLAPRPGRPGRTQAGDRTDRRKFAPEFAMWGMFATMIVFTITLNDRIAEVLAAIVFTFAIALNLFSSVRFQKGEAR